MTHAAAEPTPPTDADAVRADIEATRAELAQTVDALHDKLDVKARATASLSEVRQKVALSVSRAKATPHRNEILAGALAALVAVVVIRKRRGSGS